MEKLFDEFEVKYVSRGKAAEVIVSAQEVFAEAAETEVEASVVEEAPKKKKTKKAPVEEEEARVKKVSKKKKTGASIKKTKQ